MLSGPWNSITLFAIKLKKIENENENGNEILEEESIFDVADENLDLDEFIEEEGEWEDENSDDLIDDIHKGILDEISDGFENEADYDDDSIPKTTQ